MGDPLHKYIDQDGKIFRSSTGVSKAIETRLGFGMQRHHRMGHFSIASGPAALIIARAYDEHGLDDPRCDIKPGSEFWENSKRDRLAQCHSVLRYFLDFPNHPLKKEVVKDIKRELKYYAEN